MGYIQLFSYFSQCIQNKDFYLLCFLRAQKHLCGSAMFTGSGKKEADTDLEMVLEVEMKSQKVEEGGKSVFYLPVMSSFVVGFPVYRGTS